MSGGIKSLALIDDDVKKMLSANIHLGAENTNFQMEQYVYKRRQDGNRIVLKIIGRMTLQFFIILNLRFYIYCFAFVGINVINLKKTWEKLLLAARAVAAVEHASEVFVISSRPYGQRAVLKFAAHTGATPIAGRFTPGAFTNQIQVYETLNTLLIFCANKFLWIEVILLLIIRLHSENQDCQL